MSQKEVYQFGQDLPFVWIKSWDRSYFRKGLAEVILQIPIGHMLEANPRADVSPKHCIAVQEYVCECQNFHWCHIKELTWAEKSAMSPTKAAPLHKSLQISGCLPFAIGRPVILSSLIILQDSFTDTSDVD